MGTAGSKFSVPNPLILLDLIPVGANNSEITYLDDY